MKLHASGEDYLEAVLILQKQKGESADTWCVPLTLPGTWDSASRVSAMRWAFCGMGDFL